MGYISSESVNQQTTHVHSEVQIVKRWSPDSHCTSDPGEVATFSHLREEIGVYVCVKEHFGAETKQETVSYLRHLGVQDLAVLGSNVE